MFKRMDTQEFLNLLSLCIDNIEQSQLQELMDSEVEELYMSLERLAKVVEFTQDRMNEKISFDVPKLRAAM